MAPSIEAVLEPPSPVHPFGTDDLGRNVLSRVIYGRWISLEGGLAAVGLAAVVGTSCGLLAGFSGGAW
ncbi:MAG TPA: ABC transporter permease, partial [bacterium]|nr:ABC transporter permease [bacterium]